jgi:hypothetical protein
LLTAHCSNEIVQIACFFVLSLRKASIMQGQKLFYCLLGVVALISAGCADVNNSGEGSTFVDEGLYIKPKPCGEAGLTDVRSVTGQSLGLLEIFNDSVNLYVSYSPPTGATLTAFQIYYGDPQALPRGADHAVDPSQFPLHSAGLQEVSERTVYMDWGDMPSCITVAAYFELQQNGKAITGIAGWTPNADAQLGVSYCRKSCNVVVLQCNLADGVVLPQTLPQDQWASPAATEPQGLLRSHFNRIFPQGISLGCNERLNYATADLALAALPSVGPALPLAPQGNAPARDGNMLAGELLSLTLMAQLDEVTLEFTPHSAPLKRLVVSTGAFEGWSVEEVIQEANIVLGGCTTNFSADQIYEVVREINLAFAAGGNNQFLRCP